MKHRIVAILSMLLTVMPAAVAKNRDALLADLVKSFKKTEGVEVVDLRRPVIGLFRLIAKANVEDEEDKAVLDAVKGAKRVTIVDYEDAPAAKKAEFDAKINAILRDEDLLMEAVDGKDKVKIYGIVSGDGSIVRDFILHEEGDGTLILCQGKFDIRKLALLIGGSDD